jgi:hypothetical protein
VSISARFLVVLIGLRLLMPPGICVCKLSSPVARVLVHVLGGDVPPPAPHDDDHHPGCPASVLSLGLGVKPASPAIDAPASLPSPALPPSVPAPTIGHREDPSSHSADFNAPPFYVCHCALLI